MPKLPASKCARNFLPRLGYVATLPEKNVIRTKRTILDSSDRSKNFEKGRGGAEDNLSALTSFITNAHNEMYAFCTEKAAF